MDDTQTIHDLTAAYALYALDAEEQREYEQHLGNCEQCRAELAELSEATAALAYAVDAPAPPPELRARVLQQARGERQNVFPLRRRWVTPVAASAAVAAAAAIALGIWGSSLSNRLDRKTAEQARQERAIDILASDSGRRIALPGDRGLLVVTSSGEAALVLRRLERAPAGRVYEAWVAENGKPRPAGLFDAGTDLTAFALDLPVPNGAAVMVTEEKDGGVQVPSRAPLFLIGT